MTDERYRKRTAEDGEVLRRLELNSLEEMVGRMSPAEREEMKLVLGDRTFTVDEILEEARQGTEHGKQFLEMQAKARLERMRRS